MMSFCSFSRCEQPFDNINFSRLCAGLPSQSMMQTTAEKENPQTDGPSAAAFFQFTRNMAFGDMGCVPGQVLLPTSTCKHWNRLTNTARWNWHRGRCHFHWTVHSCATPSWLWVLADGGWKICGANPRLEMQPCRPIQWLFRRHASLAKSLFVINLLCYLCSSLRLDQKKDFFIVLKRLLFK